MQVIHVTRLLFAVDIRSRETRLSICKLHATSDHVGVCKGSATHPQAADQWVQLPLVSLSHAATSLRVHNCRYLSIKYDIYRGSSPITNGLR